MAGQLQFIQESKNPNAFQLQYDGLYTLILSRKEYFLVWKSGFKSVICNVQFIFLRKEFLVLQKYKEDINSGVWHEVTQKTDVLSVKISISLDLGFFLE